MWTGADAPNTYDNTDWADITSAVPSASVVKTLYESNSNTNALTDDKLTLLGYLTDSPDAVVSSKSFQFPPDTVFVSQNLGLEGAGEAFAVLDRASDRRGYLVAYERGSGNKPFYRKLGDPALDVTIQGAKDTDSGGQNTSHNLILKANRLVTKLYLESTETVTGASINIRRGQYLIASAANVSFTANTVKEIDIPPGIFCPNGAILVIEVEGVTLKGTGTPGTDFELFLKVDNFEFTTESLLSEGDILNGTHTGLTIQRNNATGRLDFSVTGSSFNAPSIDSFSIQNQPTEVVAGTTISGTQTFLYDVRNPENVAGDLTLTQAGTQLVKQHRPDRLFSRYSYIQYPP